MTPEQKEIWIKALRSGKYKQTTGANQHWNRFCCLGVAQEVFNLPRKDAGYIAEDFLNFKTQEILINFNDVERKSFVEIADYIEKNL